VLKAIDAAYGSGWDAIDGADPRRRGLAEAEALPGRAATLGQLGKFQLEPAIPSLPATSLVAGKPAPHGLVALHAGLLAAAPRRAPPMPRPWG
jgi:hypothetical protein